jgi:hypothetical protein
VRARALPCGLIAEPLLFSLARSLAQSPADANIICTGQVATIVNRRATAPHICVWDSSGAP